MKETQMDQGIELSDFFRSVGAFTTDYFTKKIILGFGGEFTKTSTLPTKDCFFLKDFFKDEYLVYVPAEIKTFDLDDLKKIYSFPDFLQVSFLKTLDQHYEADFHMLQTKLGENLKKVVLLSREEFSLHKNKTDLIKILFSKCLNFNSGSPYGFWNGDYGLMGNSPEFLYAIENENLSTHALAGSARKGEEEKLLASQKDRKEHEFVVSDITEKLKKLRLEVKIEKTELVSFKSMIHLKTPISAKLSSTWSHEELIGTLSPTAAKIPQGTLVVHLVLNLIRSIRFWSPSEMFSGVRINFGLNLVVAW